MNRHPLFQASLIVIGILALFVFLLTGKHSSETKLRRFAAVPAFSLTERSGKTITNKDLAGKVWVADFIFTMCPGPCPMLSANMAKLQAKHAGDREVQLVSFSVDPQDDTPAVLTEYASHLGADPERWWFLTGPQKPLYELIQNGFFQAVQDNHGKKLEEGQFLITHSIYFVLVDKQGVMRGFYNDHSDEGLTQLMRDIQQLKNE